MKHRMFRINELIKRELSEAIQKELAFENVMVTINHVDVSPDLRQGQVFVGMIGPEKDQERALGKLRENHGLLQKIVSKRVVLKFTPKLHFRRDDSVARGVNVLSIIEGIGEIEEHAPAEDVAQDAVAEEQP